MKIIRSIGVLLNKVFAPIKQNASFFFFMFLIGIIVSYEELPKDTPSAEVYQNLWLELFLDLYVICLFLMIFPKRIRRWIAGVFYVIAYTTTIIDLFCWDKFQSTLNPSMLLLAAETDKREASEFFNSYITGDLIYSGIGLILLIILLHIFVSIWSVFRRKFPDRITSKLDKVNTVSQKIQPAFGCCTLVLLTWAVISSAHNKKEMADMFSRKTIGSVEHKLTSPNTAQFYLPVYRLAFSIFANKLASQQIDRLIEARDQVRVDSCSFKSPNIVLIIGESMGRHHSQQYGYFMKTTPRQVKRERSGLLVPFSDVVSPWNLTSFVFKNIFSLHVTGQEGEWCDYPLFPQLFRKAGYHVSFITNQFLPQAKEAVYDFSGGFFLNHPELSKSMFDTRNDELHQFDEGLLDDYDKKLSHENKEHNLIIFHLIGQHVSYKLRYPSNRHHFKANDYSEKRSDLIKKQRFMLAHYDNAVLYNDSIVDQIIKRFEHKDAIVIYMPDHGEECYEGNRGFICRNHSAEIDYDLAHYEFEVPFWIYCSPKYVARHPKTFQQIKKAKDKRFMTDALPHLLLNLAGIGVKDYHAEYDILSPDYDEMRPRILKNKTNYDDLVKEHRQKTMKKP